MKRSRQVQQCPCVAASPAPRNGSSTNNPIVTSGNHSDAVPLPASHIRRTPSELQLADEVRRAEYDDVRMYARLVMGMRSQILRDQCFAGTAAAVHPLSEKSLRGVARTRAASDGELFRMSEEAEEEEEGWELSCCLDEDELHKDVVGSLDSLSWSTRPPSKTGSETSLSTRGSLMNRRDEEDDCVFSLDL